MIEKKKPKVNVDPLELIAHLLNWYLFLNNMFEILRATNFCGIPNSTGSFPSHAKQ